MVAGKQVLERKNGGAYWLAIQLAVRQDELPWISVGGEFQAPRSRRRIVSSTRPRTEFASPSLRVFSDRLYSLPP